MLHTTYVVERIPATVSMHNGTAIVDALVGDADVMDLALVSCPDERLPRLQSLLFAGQRTMDEHQVDVPYPHTQWV